MVQLSEDMRKQVFHKSSVWNWSWFFFKGLVSQHVINHLLAFKEMKPQCTLWFYLVFISTAIFNPRTLDECSATITWTEQCEGSHFLKSAYAHCTVTGYLGTLQLSETTSTTAKVPYSLKLLKRPRLGSGWSYSPLQSGSVRLLPLPSERFFLQSLVWIDYSIPTAAATVSEHNRPISSPEEGVGNSFQPVSLLGALFCIVNYLP